MTELFKRLANNWILPVEGTIGEKSQNILDNRQTVTSQGFNRAEALVVPPEYINNAADPVQFVLEAINAQLPGWTRVYVRSNVPGEDRSRRMPGLYKSELIEADALDKAAKSIDDVIASYDAPAARRFRKNFSNPETGMGLLIERAVTEYVPEMVGMFVGGEAGVLLIADPKGKNNAMMQRPIAKHKVYKGEIPNLKGADALETRVARQLYSLTEALPQKEEKVWEVEFIYDKGNFYAQQLTPVRKIPKVEVPDTADALFKGDTVYGAINCEVNGLVVINDFHSALQMAEFDDRHPGEYAVLMPAQLVSMAYNHPPESRTPRISVLFQMLKSRVFALVSHDESGPLAAHVHEYLRDSGAAFYVAGAKKGGPAQLPDELKQALYKNKNSNYYTPTRMRIAASEQSERAAVIPLEPVKPLEKIA